MIFKNLAIYRITKPLAITPEQMSAAIANRPFVPCGAQDWARKGFVAPADRSTEPTISIGNRHLTCLKIQEKILPAAAIAEALAIKVVGIEQREGRIIGRKEKKSLKENVIDELLPRALTKSKQIYAYIDFDANLLVIDSTSSSVTDSVIGSLRDVLGTLPVIPLQTNQAASIIFANWILDKAPEAFELRGACKLGDPLTGAKVSVANHDLKNEAFANLLDDGHLVESIAIEWKGECSFTLNKDLRVSQLKFSDKAVMAGRTEDAETIADVVRADFMLMYGLITQIVAILLEECGGERPFEVEQPSDNEVEPTLFEIKPAPEVISDGTDGEDELYAQAVKHVRAEERASISNIQRTFRIGYNRSARLIERMESEGVVSPMAADGSRTVILQELPA